MSRPSGSWRPQPGITIGKLQLEQITIEAAAGAPGFCPALAREQQGQEPGVPAGPLLISADCKGVAMLPGELRRRGARAPGQRVKNFEKRRGTGEKGHKRMAQTGCVSDVAPAARTPEQVMASAPAGGTKDAPRALRRWYTADIAADRAETIRAVFDEAGRRDPGHARTWVALVDGDNCQIEMIRAQAARRGVTITIVIDLCRARNYADSRAGRAGMPCRGGLAEGAAGRVVGIVTRAGQGSPWTVDGSGKGEEDDRPQEGSGSASGAGRGVPF
jgi:hypothetical protein